MENPLLYNELEDDELKSQFDQLTSAIFSINGNSSEEEMRALDERIQCEVAAEPILGRIAKRYGRVSLLWAACTTLKTKLFRPAMKCLIEANPSALLWYSNGHLPMYIIARHSRFCVLVPWIATNYQWVLDHEICILDPPVFDFLEHYQYYKLLQHWL